jgi:hypothetical protein
MYLNEAENHIIIYIFQYHDKSSVIYSQNKILVYVLLG